MDEVFYGTRFNDPDPPDLQAPPADKFCVFKEGYFQNGEKGILYWDHENSQWLEHLPKGYETLPRKAHHC